MNLTAPAYFDSGIWFPETAARDKRAHLVWSEAAKNDAINAAAATTDSNPFAKFPDWVARCVAAWDGTFLDAGCGYGRVSIPLLKSNPKLRCVGVDASPVMLEKFVQLANVLRASFGRRVLRVVEQVVEPERAARRFQCRSWSSMLRLSQRASAVWNVPISTVPLKALPGACGGSSSRRSCPS